MYVYERTFPAVWYFNLALPLCVLWIFIREGIKNVFEYPYCGGSQKTQAKGTTIEFTERGISPFPTSSTSNNYYFVIQQMLFFTDELENSMCR